MKIASIYTQDEEFCAIPVNFTANLTLGEDTVEVNGTSSNQGNHIEVAFPVEIEEHDVSIIVIMTNCMGSDHSDPIEIGQLTVFLINFIVKTKFL